MACSNITSGFVDLATYDQMEKYTHGGKKAIAYFVRETRKATWFTQVPVILSGANGTPAFGGDHSVAISRAGDYLLQAWLRVNVPSVALNAVTVGGTVIATNRLRWTRNFMHNLINECCIAFNDLVAARFDNFHLDFWTAFTVPAGKNNGYRNMIGDFPGMTGPHAPGVAIPSFTLNLPLPFFFSRDSGVALPTAALPYNEMRINYSFRDWTQLLILDDANPLPINVSKSRPVTNNDVGATNIIATVPVLGQVQTWANYAIVANNERKKMACAPRNILIEQAQLAPLQAFAPATNPNQSFDIRFSHAIKVLFFGVMNTTNAAEWSNYTAASPIPGLDLVNFDPVGAVDPIVNTTLTYESTCRLNQMGSDYYSLVQPYFHAPVIPLETGYHMYSYSLDFICLDPKGSTNYGKLTNVSITPAASAGAIAGAAGTGSSYSIGPPVVEGSGADFAQTYRFITTVVNNNIINSGDEQVAASSEGKQCFHLVSACA